MKQVKQGVGKTSLVNRFINDSFEKVSKPTISAQFNTKYMYIEKYDKNIRYEVNILINQDLGHSRTRTI